jgi:hypothetical protein
MTWQGGKVGILKEEGYGNCGKIYKQLYQRRYLIMGRVWLRPNLDS